MNNEIANRGRAGALQCRPRLSPATVAVVLIAALLGACGKRGAPLAPLNLMPEPPSALTGKRVNATVYVQMIAPKRNANGPGVVALDHLEVYAVTLRPGLMIPANRELLVPQYLVGQIAIKPPPDEDEESQETEKDTRPGPGEPVTFAEELTEKQLETSAGLKPMPPTPAPSAAAAKVATSTTTAAPPAGAAATPTTAAPSTTAAPTTTAAAPTAAAPAQTPPAVVAPGEQIPITEPAPPPSEAGPVGPPGAAALPSLPPAAPVSPAAAAIAPPATVTGPVRIYVVRGVTRKGRPGPPSTRVTMPLVPPPPPPATPSASFTERAVSLAWTAPVAKPAEPAMTFNVYPAKPAGPGPAAGPTPAAPVFPTPLNPAPIATTTFEHPGAEPGVEQCFTVRTVEKISDVNVESEQTPPVCVTPKDIFPPEAPKGLALVAMDGGVMNLIWDANTEPDLGGYLVLRGEAPGDTLQPLTPQPIHETSFRDTTARPGVRYSYAIVAVDRATPPNRSALSAKVEETAR